MLTDAEVPRFWRELGLPGLIDVHVHFYPERMLRKVWRYFDDFPNIPYPYAHQLASLARLDLGEDWLRAVCWHNACALFDLRGYFAGRSGTSAVTSQEPGGTGMVAMEEP